MSNPKVPENYFVPAPLPARIIILYLIVLNVMGLIGPDVIPEWFPLGQMTAFISINYYYAVVIPAAVFVVLAHWYEARKARSLAQELGLDEATTERWVIQTFIYGFPSLYYLIRPKTDRNAPAGPTKTKKS